MADSTLIFTLISPIELKDEITDRLMNFEHISGFNLTPIRGYSKEHSSFNLEEQVRGYKEQVQFDILINSENKQKLEEQLAPISQQTQLRYWLTNAIESGHLG